MQIYETENIHSLQKYLKKRASFNRILLESMEIGITCPFCASIGCHFYALLLLVGRKKFGMRIVHVKLRPHKGKINSHRELERLTNVTSN